MLSAVDKKINYKYNGITQKEAERALNKYGPNELKVKKKTSAVKILLSQFKDFMVIILIIATVLSMAMGEYAEAITILIIVCVNSILGFAQEYKTEKTMEKLKNMAAPNAKVIREGQVYNIPAKNIVVDDLIMLNAGDRVPADGILCECINISVDESILTGESYGVDKSINETVYMGTTVVSGKGKFIVRSTGMKTEMGKIADIIQDIKETSTPLQKKLEKLGKKIAIGCIFICIIVAATGIFRGEKIFDMLLSGISLAVAAVPEGLPAIVTISLAIGVRKMFKKNALVKKFPAVETLGCANVICSDKTGTLTQNKMSVREIYNGVNEIKVFEKNEVKISNFEDVLKTAVLCNNAVVNQPKEVKNLFEIFSKKNRDKYNIIGDSTETALIRCALNLKVDIDDINKKYVRIDEIPFDSYRKCMSVICRDISGNTYVFSKGACDILLEKCSYIKKGNNIVKLTSNDILKINNVCSKMSKKAYRVICMAYKATGSSDRSSAEKDLVFAGLVGIIDPPREEVLAAVRKCKTASIKPVMITGDHKDTAVAIAKELEIYQDGDIVLTGKELDKLSQQELVEKVNNVTVYARVSPKNKLDIIKAIKENGNIVAMTGDGVNDAPAIKEADIGVAMGITGTDVTKEASSMILLDDNFATIVSAVEEGRTIYSNIRKFIRYMLSCNIGEVITMFIGMLLGLPIPLLPVQILLINLATDGLPAIALCMEPIEPDTMKKKPNKRNSDIFSDGLGIKIITRGVLIGISTLSVYAYFYFMGYGLEVARTSAFMTLISTQLIHVFECKSEDKYLFEINIFNNIYLILAVCCSVIMMLSVVYVPFFRMVFATVELGRLEWCVIAAASLLGPVYSVLTSGLKRKSTKRK